jgi:hypothetical protein
VALCDVNRESAEKVAYDFGIPHVYADLGELLAREKPDLTLHAAANTRQARDSGHLPGDQRTDRKAHGHVRRRMRPLKNRTGSVPWLRTRSMTVCMTGKIEDVEIITSVQRRRRWRPTHRGCRSRSSRGYDCAEPVVHVATALYQRRAVGGGRRRAKWWRLPNTAHCSNSFASCNGCSARRHWRTRHALTNKLFTNCMVIEIC